MLHKQSLASGCMPSMPTLRQDDALSATWQEMDFASIGLLFAFLL
jgi:hypothetical protein